MASTNGKTTAERMVESLKGIVAVQSSSGADILKFRGSKALGNANASAYFQQAPLSTNFFTNLYGSEDEFLTKYDSFVEKYYSALSNKANHAKGTRLNVDLMKHRGKIDLKVLTKEKADELYDFYAREVLQIDKLISKGGLPGVEMPSANLYSKSFRFLTEADQSGVMHPAQILLNRSFFSFNSRKTGLESFTVSKNNLLSSRVLRELSEQSKSKNIFSGIKEGMKVFTLDVETTGVFDFSQVRSLSLAESTFEAGKLTAPKSVPNMNLLFDSPQLRGFTVGQMNGGSISLSNFLARAEGSGENALAMDTFLDESEKFIRRLLDADRIAGHNVYFDLDKITQTMMEMQGFESHTSKMGGAKEALRLLYEKIDGGNYLIDTLESTRNYLDNQVSDLIKVSQDLSVEGKSAKYVNNILAEAMQARVHIGGSAAPFSMENIALNTNLFELIERDGQAEDLFKLITKGSHVAETDVHLQTYMANYVQSGELKVWPAAQEMKINGKMQLQTEFGRFARSKVLRSQAVTPTTNIADIQNVSDNVYQYLMSEEGAKGVSINLADAGTAFGVDDLRGKQAVLTTRGNEFGLLSREGFTSVDQGRALSYVRQNLADARNERSLSPIQVGQTRQMVNMANLNINDLGISFGAGSRADQIASIGKLNLTTDITDEAIKEAFGSVYRSYGSGLASQDQMYNALGFSPRESVFEVGLGNFESSVPLQLAQKFANIGDPLYFMDAQSRSISTIISEATASTGTIANRIARQTLENSDDIAKVAFSSSPKLMAELGVSYFNAQEQASMFRMAYREMGTSKLVAPTELLKKAFKGYEDDTFRNIGLSVVKRGESQQVNLIWNVSDQLNRDQVKEMMTNIFNIMSDDRTAADALGVDIGQLNESVLKEINFISTTKAKGQVAIDEAIEAATETAMDRGIVIASAEEKSSGVIIRSMQKMGFDMMNDVNTRNIRGTVLRTALGKETVAVGPFMFDDGQKIAGVKALADDAFSVVDDGSGGKISKVVQNYNEIALKLGNNKQLRRDVSRSVKLSKAADGDRVLTEFYLKHKPKLGIGLAVSAIAGLGYYKSKKNREQNLYNEAVEKMPYQSGRELDPLAELKEGYNFIPHRMDPLATAGVVGNLDRNKIGHYQMGTNKYDHLFGR